MDFMKLDTLGVLTPAVINPVFVQGIIALPKSRKVKILYRDGTEESYPTGKDTEIVTRRICKKLHEFVDSSDLLSLEKYQLGSGVVRRRFIASIRTVLKNKKFVLRIWFENGEMYLQIPGNTNAEKKHYVKHNFFEFL